MAGCLPIARFIWVFFSLLGRHYLGPGSVGRVGYFSAYPTPYNRPKRNKQNQQNKPALKVKNRCRWCLIRGGEGVPSMYRSENQDDYNSKRGAASSYTRRPPPWSSLEPALVPRLKGCGESSVRTLYQCPRSSQDLSATFKKIKRN